MPSPRFSPLARTAVAVVLVAGASGVAACGELQPIEYTRAETTTTDPAEAFPEVTTPEEAENPELRMARYTVQPGDNLAGIAAREGVSLEVLMSVNGITDANAVEAGVVLRIPGPDDTVPPPWLQDQDQDPAAGGGAG